MKAQILVPIALIVVALGMAMARPAPPMPASDADDPTPDASAHDPKDPLFVLGYHMNRLDGTKEDLGKYKGKVILIVNTASKCGLTPQYEGLEALYKKHKDDGFVILGFPANNYGKQEPGTNKQIARFCEENYKVSFPMFEKISVLGKDQHPLYKQLTRLPEPLGGDPKWNFTKFLVDHTGRVVARFEPRVTPDDPKLVERVEALLAARPAEDSSQPTASDDH